MNNTNSKIAQILASSQENFRSFDGLGGQSQDFLAADGSNDYSRGVQINTNVKAIIIDIANSDESYELAAPLFSHNEGIAIPFNGVTCTFTKNTSQSGKGISVTPQDYSVSELSKLAGTGAYILRGVRYNHGDAAQLQIAWGLRYKDNSQVSTDKFRPSFYKNLANQVSDIVDSEEFFMAVDAKATLFVSVLKATAANVPRKIQVAFRVASETNMLNLLKGRSILELNSTYGK